MPAASRTAPVVPRYSCLIYRTGNLGDVIQSMALTRLLPRSGVLSVDCDGPGERITHDISRTLSVEGQWRRAVELLGRYRTAEAVHTSRLHVALPCLAFGTPVSRKLSPRMLSPWLSQQETRSKACGSGHPAGACQQTGRGCTRERNRWKHERDGS